MTIRESISFTYAGQSSVQHGLLNVNVSQGLLEEPFLAERRINEVSVRGRENPYFQDLEYSPLQFTLSFAFQDTWDESKKREIARWLGGQSYYQPLVFTDGENSSRWYYCLFVDGASLIHNGLSQGYVNLNARCNGPFAYSPIYESAIYEYVNNSLGSSYIFENNGDVSIKPRVIIEKIGNGNIRIVNESNMGQELIIEDLVDHENIIVDNDQETIETDIPLTSRYDNHNDVFLEMVHGLNHLKIYGDCKLKWIFQYKFY